MNGLSEKIAYGFKWYYTLAMENQMPGEELVLRVASGEVASIEEEDRGRFKLQIRSEAHVYVEGSMGRKSALLTLEPPNDG